MIEKIGSIWTHHNEGGWIVIPTNVGWKKDGTNPMGAGLAKIASDQFPGLAEWYGQKCQNFREKTAVLPYKKGKLFLFPTKKLATQPWMSWQQDSCPDLIKISAEQLVLWLDIFKTKGTPIIKKVGVPLVGCDNGNLHRKQVLPILRKYLDDRFVLIERS